MDTGGLLEDFDKFLSAEFKFYFVGGHTGDCHGGLALDGVGGNDGSDEGCLKEVFAHAIYNNIIGVAPKGTFVRHLWGYDIFEGITSE